MLFINEKSNTIGPFYVRLKKRNQWTFRYFKKSFFKPSRSENLLRMDLDSFLWLLERVSFLKILFIFFYFSFGFFKPPKKIAQENEISNIFFIQLQVDSMIFKIFVKPRSFKKDVWI